MVDLYIIDSIQLYGNYLIASYSKEAEYESLRPFYSLDFPLIDESVEPVWWSFAKNINIPMQTVDNPK